MKENKFVNKNRGINLEELSLRMLEKAFGIMKSEGITNTSQIVCMLNQMLDMEQTDQVRSLYIEMCLYYRTIDKEMAMEYAQFYLDTYNDESVILAIKENEKKGKKLTKIL